MKSAVIILFNVGLFLLAPVIAQRLTIVFTRVKPNYWLTLLALFVSQMLTSFAMLAALILVLFLTSATRGDLSRLFDSVDLPGYALFMLGLFAFFGLCQAIVYRKLTNRFNQQTVRLRVAFVICTTIIIAATGLLFAIEYCLRQW